MKFGAFFRSLLPTSEVDAAGASATVQADRDAGMRAEAQGRDVLREAAQGIHAVAARALQRVGAEPGAGARK